MEDAEKGHTELYQKMMSLAGVTGGYHRDGIFDEVKRSDYLWCLQCGRTYRRGEYRYVDGFQMCPYENCDGSTVCDGIDWEDIRDDHPDYPENPERNTMYNL